jgi:hypothetical protein
MRCKNCGEEIDFVLIRVTAKWNDKEQDWDRSYEAEGEDIMCNTCHSYDIEYVK